MIRELKVEASFTGYREVATLQANADRCEPGAKHGLHGQRHV